MPSRFRFKPRSYPSLSTDDADEYRAHYQRSARQQLAALLQAALARAGAADEVSKWKIRVRLGSARTVIERATKQLDADLLVLGTHGYAGISYAFLGSVAGDVLREVACDALVVPPRRTKTQRGSGSMSAIVSTASDPSI